MASALRVGVYALSIGVFFGAQGFATSSFAKDGKEAGTVNSSGSAAPSRSAASTEFQWKDHNKLSWDDFKGPVNAVDEESAAATHCGIGFRLNRAAAGAKPEIVVYNTFYVNKSWVRSDARIGSILNHEQGHFDLCEIYTRKLRSRLEKFDFAVSDVKETLMHIFTEVNNEYETCQQAYEVETTHGTNLDVQRRWQEKISRELYY